MNCAMHLAGASGMRSNWMDFLDGGLNGCLIDSCKNVTDAEDQRVFFIVIFLSIFNLKYKQYTIKHIFVSLQFF